MLSCGSNKTPSSGRRIVCPGESDDDIAEIGVQNSNRPLYTLTVGILSYWGQMVESENDDFQSFCRSCRGSGFIERLESFEMCKYCCPGRAVIASRYSVIRQIGVGAFSQVFLVKDLYLNEMRVVKILRSGLHSLAHSEAEILVKLVRLGGRRVGSVNFYGLVKVGESWLGLMLEYLQPLPTTTLSNAAQLGRLIVDVALVLATLHSQQIIHADIKVDNIMWSELEGRFKLIDFGNCTPLEAISEYYGESFEIQSLLYRAPEVLVGLVDFGVAIDIWSFGVAIVHLLMRRGESSDPDFRSDRYPFTGKDRLELLLQISEIMGPLPCSFLKGKFYHPSLPLTSSFADRSGAFWQRWKNSNLARLLGIRDVRLLDLLSGMLEVDPRRRLSAKDILRHSYLAPLIPFPP